MNGLGRVSPKYWHILPRCGTEFEKSAILAKLIRLFFD